MQAMSMSWRYLERRRFGLPERSWLLRDQVSRPPGGPRLLNDVRAALRLRHYSRRTEEAYVGWVRRLVIQQGLRHPRELRRAEVTAFLSHLASERRVSASTQNQALSALLFLYQDVLGRELEWLDDVVRAKAPRRLPVVLARDEVRSLVASLEGTPRLVATLLYGSGTRLLEALPLRVHRCKNT